MNDSDIERIKKDYDFRDDYDLGQDIKKVKDLLVGASTATQKHFNYDRRKILTKEIRLKLKSINDFIASFKNIQQSLFSQSGDCYLFRTENFNVDNSENLKKHLTSPDLIADLLTEQWQCNLMLEKLTNNHKGGRPSNVTEKHVIIHMLLLSFILGTDDLIDLRYDNRAEGCKHDGETFSFILEFVEEFNLGTPESIYKIYIYKGKNREKKSIRDSFSAIGKVKLQEKNPSENRHG